MNYTDFKEKLFMDLKKLYPNSTAKESVVYKNNLTSYDMVINQSKEDTTLFCIEKR